MNLIDVIELSKLNCKIPMQVKLVYATRDNFAGKILNGYHPDAHDFCLLTTNAAIALCKVQNYLIEKYNLGLFIFDGYRPKRAVMDLIAWSNAQSIDKFEEEKKLLHYPNLNKNELFPLGYVSEDSNHCYGNTVDLSLIDLNSSNLKDMGAIFDFLDERSHLTKTADDLGAEAFQNRKILVEAMTLFDFEPYVKEYWHFAHGGISGREVKEPIDIEIVPKLKGFGVLK